MVYNTLKSIIWGFKNAEDIFNIINEAKNCDKCDDLDFENNDGVCKEHRESYERLVQNGPYGRSITDIINN